MKQSFYTFANFFLGLSILMAVFNSILYYFLGESYLLLDAFKNWYLAENVVGVAVMLCMLRYYHVKKYQVSLWTAGVAAVTAVCYAILVYALMLMYRELHIYYISMVLATVSTGIVYALSLIFSESGKRTWLKWAGITSGVVGLVLLAICIYQFFMSGNPLSASSSLIKIYFWTLRLGNLIPVFFILNFSDESKHAAKEKLSRTDQISETWAGLSALLCLLFGLFAGVMLASRGYDVLHVPKRAKLMAEPFEARFYVGNSGDTLMYRIMKPLNYDSRKSYPLVVGLPYTCADDNERQIAACDPAQWLTEAKNRERYPAFIFVPRCPKGTGWGGVPNNPSVEKLALEAISALVKQPGIDKKRVYVTGISRGGYGSWHFIGTRPDLFAAAIPICGGDDPLLGKNMVHVAVWAFHGAKDRNVPVAGSRDLIASIRKAGGHPRYTEYPNREHGIWDLVKTTPGLLDWLFAQKQE